MRHPFDTAVSEQQELFGYTRRVPVTALIKPADDYTLPGMATTPLVHTLLRANAPVGIGISGGKDSSAMAATLKKELDALGHTGPRLLIHADLGRAEWGQSMGICEELAKKLDMPLRVVKRHRGDMVDRWYQRWADNANRYADLLLVKALLPWSTAGMRFCTSELKTSVIARALVKLYPGQTILSTTGIRRQESDNRKNKPVESVNNALTNKTANTTGHNWNPIVEWSEEDVWALHHQRNLPIHEAYTTYNMSRVSCAFCVLSSLPDLTNSATCKANHTLFSELVDLEITSTFSFQDKRWLADISPALLSDTQRAGLYIAKENAVARQRAEAEIPPHLLYEKGWPLVMPTYSEAALLGQIRAEVGSLIGIAVKFTQPDAIIDRYGYLMQQAREKNQKSGSISDQCRTLPAPFKKDLFA